MNTARGGPRKLVGTMNSINYTFGDSVHTMRSALKTSMPGKRENSERLDDLKLAIKSVDQKMDKM